MTALSCQAEQVLTAEVATAGFDSANKLYEQGKFAEAAAAYEQLLQSGAVSAAVYFNLGNARYKTGELGRALAAYHHAERLAPRDPDIAANLQFARQKVQSPTLSPGRAERVLNRLTLNEWTGLAAGAFWLWLLLLAARQLRSKPAGLLRQASLACGILFLVFGACLAAAYSAQSKNKVIVASHEATVHNGPLEESPAAFKVHDGAELHLLDEKNGWVQVSLGDRRVGWLKQEEIISAPRL